jgi:hypothetical protein
MGKDGCRTLRPRSPRIQHTFYPSGTPHCMWFPSHQAGQNRRNAAGPVQALEQTVALTLLTTSLLQKDLRILFRLHTCF